MRASKAGLDDACLVVRSARFGHEKRPALVLVFGRRNQLGASPPPIPTVYLSAADL